MLTSIIIIMGKLYHYTIEMSRHDIIIKAYNNRHLILLLNIYEDLYDLRLTKMSDIHNWFRTKKSPIHIKCFSRCDLYLMYKLQTEDKVNKKTKLYHIKKFADADLQRHNSGCFSIEEFNKTYFIKDFIKCNICNCMVKDNITRHQLTQRCKSSICPF